MTAAAAAAAAGAVAVWLLAGGQWRRRWAKEQVPWVNDVFDDLPTSRPSPVRRTSTRRPPATHTTVDDLDSMPLHGGLL